MLEDQIMTELKQIPSDKLAEISRVGNAFLPTICDIIGGQKSVAHPTYLIKNAKRCALIGCAEARSASIA